MTTPHCHHCGRDESEALSLLHCPLIATSFKQSGTEMFFCKSCLLSYIRNFPWLIENFPWLVMEHPVINGIVEDLRDIDRKKLEAAEREIEALKQRLEYTRNDPRIKLH